MAFENVPSGSSKQSPFVRSAKRSLLFESAFDPLAFYLRCAFMHPGSGFVDMVLRSARTVSPNKLFQVLICETGRLAGDADIESAFRRNHYFDETTLCAVLASLTICQWNGVPGDLAVAQHANFMYMRERPVFFYWEPASSAWQVKVWWRDNLPRVAGTRVIVPWSSF